MLLHLLTETRWVMDTSPFNNLRVYWKYESIRRTFWNSPRKKALGLSSEAVVDVCVCVCTDKCVLCQSVQLRVKSSLKLFCRPFSISKCSSNR